LNENFSIRRKEKGNNNSQAVERTGFIIQLLVNGFHESGFHQEHVDQARFGRTRIAGLSFAGAVGQDVFVVIVVVVEDKEPYRPHGEGCLRRLVDLWQG
jgi:hypothetical protein